jgi:hypothetical protein
MFITKTHLDRRTFLRGMGATVALPLLDAMIPARTLLPSTAARAVPRLAFVYFPHGAVMHEWSRDGRVLQPLAPFGNRLTIVSGLENHHAYGPVHAITPGTWLSGVSPRQRGTEISGATADQLAAECLGRDAPMPSIAVATEQPTKIGAGVWEGEYDESYGTTISFRRGRVPVPMEFRPRAVFDAIYHRAPGSTSVLDLVAGDVATLRKRLGPSDRSVLTDYLDTLREVERRVYKVDKEDKAGAEESFVGRMALMFDLIVLAFRADITRVASMMMAAEASSMTYAHLGVPDSFHLVSHHQNDPGKIEKLVRIQTFHTRMFAAFIRALAELPDGDGTILDRSIVLYGSNMSDSHAHDHFPLPLAVVGGTLHGGQHLHSVERTPISNLLLTVLRRAEVPVDSIGDSTGECSGL